MHIYIYIKIFLGFIVNLLMNTLNCKLLFWSRLRFFIINQLCKKVCRIKRWINAEVIAWMIDIFLAWLNLIHFMIFGQKFSVISEHPLHVEVICLEIWKIQKNCNSLLQSRTFLNLYPPSNIYCHNTLLKFCQMKRDSVTSFRLLVTTVDCIFLCWI